MKTKYIFYTLIVIMSLCFVACEDKDEEKPVISNLEVGHDGTIHAGEGIHLDFKVADNEGLDYYQISIHAEEGEHDHKSLHEHWSFDSTFTEISGKKNSTVHHHEIVVPEEAEEGKYHFHLTVADEEGNTASEEVELDLVHEEHDDDHEDGHHDHDHDHEDDHEDGRHGQ
jgi:hypothetical protein